MILLEVIGIMQFKNFWRFLVHLEVMDLQIWRFLLFMEVIEILEVF